MVLPDPRIRYERLEEGEFKIEDGKLFLIPERGSYFSDYEDGITLSGGVNGIFYFEQVWLYSEALNKLEPGAITEKGGIQAIQCDKKVAE